MKAAQKGMASERQGDEPLIRWAELHLLSRPHTTSTLARALGISTATTSRILTTLKRRGKRIFSVKEGRRWHYEIDDREVIRRRRKAVEKFAGFIHEPILRPGETEDDVLYGPGAI